MRSGSAASMRPRRMVASVGEAPPVEIATTTSSRSTIAGRMKSQSAGRSATFTGTPSDLATRWAAVSRSSIAGGDEGRGGAAEIGEPGPSADSCRTSAPAERAEVGATVGGRPLAHHHDPAADKIEEQRQVLHEHGDPQQDVEGQHGGCLARSTAPTGLASGYRSKKLGHRGHPLDRSRSGVSSHIRHDLNYRRSGREGAFLAVDPVRKEIFPPLDGPKDPS